MTNEEYFFYKERIDNLLSLVRNVISPDGLELITHYLTHAEIEMAFEILCLEIIEGNIELTHAMCNELRKLFQEFDLTTNFVFEPKITEKLNVFLAKCIELAA